MRPQGVPESIAWQVTVPPLPLMLRHIIDNLFGRMVLARPLPVGRLVLHISLSFLTGDVTVVLPFLQRSCDFALRCSKNCCSLQKSVFSDHRLYRRHHSRVLIMLEITNTTAIFRSRTTECLLHACFCMAAFLNLKAAHLLYFAKRS